jgi:hypothetical protein
MRIVEFFAEHVSNMKKIKTYETDNLEYLLSIRKASELLTWFERQWFCELERDAA